MEVLGIDIGGSGMKAAIIELTTGEMVTERYRIDTPQPATPKAMVEVVKKLQKHFDWKGRIGVGFPAAIVNGFVKTASNIDSSWINTPITKLFTEATGCEVSVMNDVDVTGLAEMNFGAGKDRKGKVLTVALGTGIGTALFYNGQLIPNTELGHLQMKGLIAEDYAANSVRENEELSWKEWGMRLNEYLLELDKLLWPDLIIIGGGVSKHYENFEQYLDRNLAVVPAALKNHAGIIGSASQLQIFD